MVEQLRRTLERLSRVVFSKINILLGLIALLLFFNYYFIALNFCYNSDDAMVVLIAESINNGAWLKGWYLTTELFVIEIFAYALLGKFIGVSYHLLYLIPSAFLSLTILFAALAFSLDNNARVDIKVFLMLTALAFSVTPYFAGVNSMGLSHNGAIMLCTLGILLLRMYMLTNKKSYITFVFIINLLTIGSDKLSLYFYLFPVLFSIAYILLRENIKSVKIKNFKSIFFGILRTNRQTATILSVFLLSTLLSFICKVILEKILDCYVGGYTFKFNNWKTFVSTVYEILKGFAYMLNIHDFSFLSIILAIIVAAIFTLSVIYELKQPTFMGAFVLTGFIFLILGSLATKKFGDFHSIRYFSFSIIFLKVFTIFCCYRFVKKQNLLVLIVISVAILGWLIQPSYTTTLNNDGYGQLLNTLNEKKLTQGYGTYWNSMVFSVMSNFNTMVYQIKEKGYPADNGLYAEYWGVADRWYDNEANFLVMSNYETSVKELAVRQFGEPSQIVEFSEKVLFIWDYDISTKLRKNYVHLKHFSRTRNCGDKKCSWGSNFSEIHLNNYTGKPVNVQFSFNLRVPSDNPYKVRINGLFNDEVTVGHEEKTITKKLKLKDKTNVILIKSDSPLGLVDGESYFRKFSISDMSLTELD